MKSGSSSDIDLHKWRFKTDDSLAEAACVGLGKTGGIGEVFNLIWLRAQHASGPSGSLTRYGSALMPSALMRK